METSFSGKLEVGTYNALVSPQVNEMSATFRRMAVSNLDLRRNCQRMSSYVALLSSFCFLLSVRGEVLNLVEPPNYSEQPVPSYIHQDNTLSENPITNLGALLGRVLFYDRRLSSNGQVSCASCHQQQHAFSDPESFSRGVSGETNRRSMRLINVRFSDGQQMFWDKRARDVETQATMPIRDHLEMGFSGQGGQPPFEALLTELRSIEDYRLLFSTVFGDSAVTESRMQLALAQFIRSIQSFDSPYDEGRAMITSEIEDFPNFSEAQNRGKWLFNSSPLHGGAGCASCHRPPEFGIDSASQGNGITGSRNGDQDFSVTRAPTLRDLVDIRGRPHSAFMHDSSLANLVDVVSHYANVDDLVPNLDSRVRLNSFLFMNAEVENNPFSEQGKLDLVSFLATLTGTGVYTDSKWSDPFSPKGDLNIQLLSDESLEFQIIKTTLRSYLRLRLRVAPHLIYRLEKSTDLENWVPIEFILAEAGTVYLLFPVATEQENAFHRLVFRLEDQPLRSSP